MSTPEENEEAVLHAAERIARMALGDITVEEYAGLLFSICGTLAGFRAAMSGAGYSNYLIEKAAWLILTSFYGHHLSTTEIDFEPVQHG